MAISQDRILRVLHAGQSYRQAFERLSEYLKAGVASGERQAWQSLLAIANEAIRATPPLSDVEALAIEIDHFRRNARANAQAKLRMARKRQMLGVVPRPGASETLTIPPPTQGLSRACGAGSSLSDIELDLIEVPIPEGALVTPDSQAAFERMVKAAEEELFQEELARKKAIAEGRAPAPAGVRLGI